jgi:hypothetical protein
VARQNQASTAMTTIMPTQKTVSRHAASGQNGAAFFFNQFLVFLAVGFGINRFAGFGRLGNAVAQDQPARCSPTKAKMKPGMMKT